MDIFVLFIIASIFVVIFSIAIGTIVRSVRINKENEQAFLNDYRKWGQLECQRIMSNNKTLF